MSDGSLGSNRPEGPGWWQATDGRWYPPEADATIQIDADAIAAATGGRKPGRRPWYRNGVLLAAIIGILVVVGAVIAAFVVLSDDSGDSGEVATQPDDGSAAATPSPDGGSGGDGSADDSAGDDDADGSAGDGADGDTGGSDQDTDVASDDGGTTDGDPGGSDQDTDAAPDDDGTTDGVDAVDDGVGGVTVQQGTMPQLVGEPSQTCPNAKVEGDAEWIDPPKGDIEALGNESAWAYREKGPIVVEDPVPVDLDFSRLGFSNEDGRQAPRDGEVPVGASVCSYMVTGGGEATTWDLDFQIPTRCPIVGITWTAGLLRSDEHAVFARSVRGVNTSMELGQGDVIAWTKQNRLSIEMDNPEGRDNVRIMATCADPS